MPDRRRIVGRSPADRAASVTRSPRQRSSVTNGSVAFLNGDNGSAWARRHIDLVAAHVSDLGGISELSEAQVSLCKRAATLECELERLDSALTRDEAIDLDLYSRVSGQLRRLLETIGLDRRAREVGNNRSSIRDLALANTLDGKPL